VTVVGVVLTGDIGEFWPFGATIVFYVFFGLAGEFGGDDLHGWFKVNCGRFYLADCVERAAGESIAGQAPFTAVFVESCE